MITGSLTVTSIPRYNQLDESSGIPGYPLFYVWSVLTIINLMYIESSEGNTESESKNPNFFLFKALILKYIKILIPNPPIKI